MSVLCRMAYWIAELDHVHLAFAKVGLQDYARK
ncbi:hypothetical protein Tco_0700031, partial [Tanacetum coccineum]